MIDLTEAKRIALAYLATIRSTTGLPIHFMIIDQLITDESWGWVIPYNDRRYVEGGDWMFKLYGNFPLAVVRATGAVHSLVYLHGRERLEDAIRKLAAELEAGDAPPGH